MSQEELVEALYVAAKEARRNFKRSAKLCEKECKEGFSVSRARQTTNVAASYNATRMFNQNIELIKKILPKIF